MTARPVSILVASAFLACSASSVGARAAKSPFFGTWQLDLSRMPANYGTPPKKVTFAFDEAADGQWRTTVDITGQDDSVRHMTAEYRPDGHMAKIEGDTAEADSVASMSPAPNVLVVSMVKNKVLDGVRTWVISPDGKELTESAASVDNDGVPFVRNFHFKRVGG